MKNPRILLIGHSFQPTGIGVTIKNLFSGFPKESLSCISSRYYKDDIAFSSFYLLGKKEVKLLFPFNLFEKITNSKTIEYKDIKQTDVITDKRGSRSTFKHKVYKKIVYPLLKGCKLYIYRNKLQISNDLINWVKKTQPSIIYSALGSLSMMKFVLDIHSHIPDSKLVIHIMDDWISTQSEVALFSHLYKSKSLNYFHNILNKSSVRLVISEKMAEVYNKRFGGHFIAFHNPVNILEYDKTIIPHTQTRNKTVTYIGKINKDNVDVINDMIKAVDAVNAKKTNLKFIIYTPTDQIFVEQNIISSPNTKILNEIQHQFIPSVLISSNILFLPLSFEEKSKRYTHLSISTKVTEYMASLRPMIVYAPPDIALTEYVNKYRIAYSVTQRDINLLTNAVFELLNNSNKSKELANNAFMLAKEKHSMEKVSADFKRILTKLII